MGFSFADEHIREMTLRAANSNPTLLIKIYAYNATAKQDIEANIRKGNTVLKYKNIEVIEPPAGTVYDFKTLNDKIFSPLLVEVE